MSSATNHKKRSRRGYKMQRTYLAPKHSPLISQDNKKKRKLFRYMMSRLFQHPNSRKEG